MEKLEYPDINKYLHLKGLRSEQICRDMFSTFGEQCPSEVTFYAF